MWINSKHFVFFSIGIETVEIGGDTGLIFSTTSDGVALRQNMGSINVRLQQRLHRMLIEQWFNGIVAGLRDADFIVLSAASLFAGLCCIEKYPHIKAIAIYAFPFLRTAEFPPPCFSQKSTSLFKWINSLKWTMFQYLESISLTNYFNELRARIDLQPIKLNYDQMILFIYRKPMIRATVYSQHLVPRPSDWQENDLMVGAIFNERCDDFEPSTPLLAFLSKWKNEKIIYVGFGSMMRTALNTDEQIAVLNKVQLALENNNSKAVISVLDCKQTHLNQLSNTNEILYSAEYIPHCWIFPHVSATIHHGGAGTLHAGLRYGLPTLVLPFLYDQPFNGDRVFLNDLGPKPISIWQIDVKNLTNAIRDLISDNYNKYEINAKKISELMRNEDGLSHCVQLIEAELTH